MSKLFKLQNPMDVLTRALILEYFRELSAEVMYKEVNKEQQKLFFYKYTTGDIREAEEISVDFNWEFLLFEASMAQLDFLSENFADRIIEIETARQKIYKEFTETREAKLRAGLNVPVDINLMDIARADINDKSIRDINGKKFN